MSKQSDLETDVLLSRLCTRVVKNRANAKVDEVFAEDGGYRAAGWWEGKKFCIAIVRVAIKGGA